MPVGWAAAAAAVGTVGAAAIGADASRDAARTQQQGAGEASRVQREMFNTTLRQQQPFVQSGYAANAELSRLMGLGAPGSGPGGGGGPGGGLPVVGGWEANGGQLVGDTWLPPGTTTRPVPSGKPGWFEVWDGSQRVGTLRPGGGNGRFINDTGWAMPTPQQALSGGGGGTGSEFAPNAAGGIDQRFTGGGDSKMSPPGGAPGGPGGSGLPTGYLTQTFGPQQFLQGMDPGYAWRLQQGAQGVMNTAAAGSGSLSGPALKALMEYNQGAASQEFGAGFDRFQTQQGNIFQRLTSLAQTGQNAAAGVGQNATVTGGNIGANIIGGANAGAAGQVGAANAYGGALSDIGSLGMLWAMNRQPPAPLSTLEP